MDHINSSSDHEALSPDTLAPGRRVYFIGIGGISMGGLAELAAHAGLTVGGSDLHAPPRLERLAKLGITVDPEQSEAAIRAFGPDLAVYSAAVPPSNPQRIWADTAGIVSVERAEFLGWLNRRYTRVINISGTNGKTTTTAMCALMLLEADADPSVHLGAELRSFDMSTVRIGRTHELLVSEACEYKDSFLRFYSTTGVILNIDLDHVDYFSGIEAIITSFARFGANIPDGGTLIAPADDPYIVPCLEEMERMRAAEGKAPLTVLRFGIVDDPATATHLPDFYATDLTWEQGLPRFRVVYRDHPYADIQMALPGRHNVLDALAAMLAAELNGGTADASAQTLADFTGAEGRFNIKGTFRGATVIADYAHNPSKTRATMAAAHTLPHEKIHVVYQPLTYGRVRQMWDEYLTVLDTADRILFVPIYSDREQETFGMSSELLADAYRAKGKDARFFPDYPAVEAELSDTVHPGDLILFLGPEDVRTYADRLTNV